MIVDVVLLVVYIALIALLATVMWAWRGAERRCGQWRDLAERWELEARNRDDANTLETWHDHWQAQAIMSGQMVLSLDVHRRLQDAHIARLTAELADARRDAEGAWALAEGRMFGGDT